MRADIALDEGIRTGGTGAAHNERPLWQVALAAWLGQRLLVVGLIIAWQVESGVFSAGVFFKTLTTYDSAFYITIAQTGYHTLPQAAFFPLYPLLMHLTAPLVGGHVTLAGLLLANLCSLAAFLLLGQLVAHTFDTRIARRTLLYYALFPTGLFFAAVYTEALFLLLSVGVFLCLRQRRWGWAGLLITLATLSRAQGVLLLLPLALEAWTALRPVWRELARRERLRAVGTLLGACGLPLVALFAFQLYLAHLYGVPDVLSLAMSSQGWQRHLDWPWAGTLSDLITLLRYGMRGLALEIIKNLAFLAVWLGLSALMLLPRRWVAWLALPRSWVAYSWAVFIQTLSFPDHAPGEGLMSVPRYMLVAFPCFALLALLGVRYPRLHLITFALSILALVVVTRLQAGGIFVA